jgi:hypothetical protein
VVAPAATPPSAFAGVTGQLMVNATAESAAMTNIRPDIALHQPFT